MATATKFAKVLDQIPTDYNDSQARIEVPQGFVEAWRAHAEEVTFPFGEDSYDPSEKWVFSDGSTVTVANPRQAAFRLQVSSIC